MTVASRTAASHYCAYFNTNNNDFSWRNRPVTGEINEHFCKNASFSAKDAATVLIKNRRIICVNLSLLYLIREANTVIPLQFDPEALFHYSTVFLSRDLKGRNIYSSAFSRKSSFFFFFFSLWGLPRYAGSWFSHPRVFLFEPPSLLI